MIKRFTDIVLFSSLFISLGSAALVIRTYYIIEKPLDWGIVVFVFFATLFTYNISKIIPLYSFLSREKDTNYAYNLRNQWNVKYKKELFFLSIISLLSILVFAIDFSWNQLLFLLQLGIISIVYSTPIFSGKALRSIPMIKIFLIAYVWASMSILPFINNDELINENVIYIFIDSFLFILAITIPFDIRDYSRDKSQGLKTIPVVFGENKSKLLSVLSLIITIVVNHFILQNSTQELINLFLTIVFIFIVFNSKEKYSEYYYLGLIDGMLILRLIAFMI